MLNILVKEYPHFRDKNPSLLGASIVYAARKKQDVLREPWSRELQILTRYQESQLVAIADKLIKLSMPKDMCDLVTKNKENSPGKKANSPAKARISPPKAKKSPNKSK